MTIENIQIGIYNYLESHLDIPVESRIDLDTTMPYVAMGDLQLNRNSARGVEGLDMIQEISVYSNFNGKDEVIKYADKIRNLILNSKLDIVGAQVLKQEASKIEITQLNESLYEALITYAATLFNTNI